MLLVLFLPRVVSWTASFVFSPVIAVESWFHSSTSAVPSYFRDRNSLLATQSALEAELEEIKTTSFTVDRLLKENEELKSLLGSDDALRIAASAIGRPTDLPYDVLVIDKGSEDGVINNAPIFIGKDQVIGFVAEVYSHTAVVTLVTTPGFESTVYIYGPNIYTTAIGIGGGSLQVRVPQGITLEIGNVVVMPSFDAGVYGEISSVDYEPTRPEQYGYVSIDIPLQSIRYVSVGNKPLAVMSFDDAKAVVSRVRKDFLEVAVPSGVLVDVPIDEATSTATTSVQTTSSL